MKDYVLDCSVTVTWCFKEEATAQTDALLGRLEHETAWVPDLWYLEISNVLAKDERRGRITANQMKEAIKFLESFSIKVDEKGAYHIWQNVLELARAEKLTTYDATYLELAMRRKLPLATIDGDLIKAAQRNGIKTLPQ